MAADAVSFTPNYIDDCKTITGQTTIATGETISSVFTTITYPIGNCIRQNGELLIFSRQ